MRTDLTKEGSKRPVIANIFEWDAQQHCKHMGSIFIAYM